jgi:hypothetical protein
LLTADEEAALLLDGQWFVDLRESCKRQQGDDRFTSRIMIRPSFLEMLNPQSVTIAMPIDTPKTPSGIWTSSSHTGGTLIT